MRKILATLILIFVFAAVYPQFLMRKQVVEPKAPDSLDLSYYSEKKWLQATGGVVGFNLGLWAFDRYVQKADFAYISSRSIRRNFKRGFIWDNDQMGTNMFMHPYHGSLYHNSARSSGFNYWQAGGFSLGGSLMWELIMENEYPSTNDLIATPIGGLAIGEVLYRASDMILDDRKQGNERFGREFAAFLIAPTRSLSRIITGDAWKKRPTSGRQFGIPDISLEISAGIRALELRDEIFDKGIGATTQINIEYGDRYDGDHKKPFDYFNFRINLNVHASQPLLGQINVMGRLWAADVIDNSKDYLNLGIYQHFDYYDSDTISSVSSQTPYKLGVPASVGVGYIHKSKRFRHWDFNSYAHLNVLILGASLSDHYLVDQRNYNLGSGFGWKVGVSLSYRDIIGASWWHEGYKMYTWKGYPEGYDISKALDNEINAQGDKSNVTFYLTSLKVDVKLKKALYLTGVASLYYRNTRYSYFENVKSTTGQGGLMLTYKF